jgi:hypothetical protein
MKNGMRYEQFRLAKRGDEYLTQARYVWADTKPTSKWWEFWKAEYEMVYEYEEWRDIPATKIE